jgi:hypothetical protein
VAHHTVQRRGAVVRRRPTERVAGRVVCENGQSSMSVVAGIRRVRQVQRDERDEKRRRDG